MHINYFVVFVDKKSTFWYLNNYSQVLVRSYKFIHTTLSITLHYFIMCINSYTLHEVLYPQICIVNKKLKNKKNWSRFELLILLTCVTLNIMLWTYIMVLEKVTTGGADVPFIMWTSDI